MPKREKGEKLSSFISRFVGSKREESKFPDQKQRLAVAFSEAKEQSRRERRRG
jgi:16S rRNA U1498 N3-methylase RsmE